MLKKCACLLTFVAIGLQILCADTIQLREKAAVTGKILTEKKDQVVVDLGFTVLAVPRSQILKISKDDATPIVKPAGLVKALDPGAAAAASDALKADTAIGFYSSLRKNLPASTVRDLVNQLGEAVVQVRTPSGLGSGFIINEDGFLITNFHVTEGETQLSIEVYHQANGELQRKSYKQIRIVAMNKFADLALLKIDDKDAPKFKYVSFGSADALAVGDGVFAIGSPLGL